MTEPEGRDDWSDVVEEADSAVDGNVEPMAAPAPAGTATDGDDAGPQGRDREVVIAEAMRVAEEACKEIMRCSGFDVRVLAVPGDPVRIELQGPDAGRIIGRRGATLQSLQYLVARIVGHRVSRHIRVKVDVEGYRVRRENTLRGLAQRAADRAVRDGRPIELDPMTPEERRVIHLALADDGDVRTESVGEGDDRRVCVIPADEADRRDDNDPKGGTKADADA
jgi:spoIIIJ-associated protein